MAKQLSIRGFFYALWEGFLDILRTLKAADFSADRKQYTYAVYAIGSLILALAFAILFHFMPTLFALLTVLHLSGVAAYAFLVLVSFMGFLGHGLAVSGKVALFGDDSNDKAKRSFRDLLVPYLKIAIGVIMMMPFVILFHTKLMLPFFKITSQWLLIPIAMLMPILLGGPFFLLSLLSRVLASKMDRSTWYGHVLHEIFNLLSKVFLFAAIVCTVVFSINPHVLSEGCRTFMAYTAGPFYSGTQSLSLWPTIYAGMAKFVGVVCVLLPPLRYARMVWTEKDRPREENSTVGDSSTESNSPVSFDGPTAAGAAMLTDVGRIDKIRHLIIKIDMQLKNIENMAKQDQPNWVEIKNSLVELADESFSDLYNLFANLYHRHAFENGVDFQSKVFGDIKSLKNRYEVLMKDVRVWVSEAVDEEEAMSGSGPATRRGSTGSGC